MSSLRDGTSCTSMRVGKHVVEAIAGTGIIRSSVVKEERHDNMLYEEVIGRIEE